MSYCQILSSGGVGANFLLWLPFHYQLISCRFKAKFPQVSIFWKLKNKKTKTAIVIHISFKKWYKIVGLGCFDFQLFYYTNFLEKKICPWFTCANSALGKKKCPKLAQQLFTCQPSKGHPCRNLKFYFSIMFYHSISTRYQKIGDLFYPVHIFGLSQCVHHRSSCNRRSVGP